ncbi:hypothetical protein GALMADRAFT_249741 [Galerina marginata CBS 339.88]|uniref:Uncharacterized protein n=1 Tax=Galerina marginata (strain CBS 339.88) TaxID=685588 RepID=A0A067SVC1_GALM3|nr:hypothetical protein GALMADRAFT_249741 [Galerina marginata CBS 339.88]
MEQTCLKKLPHSTTEQQEPLAKDIKIFDHKMLPPCVPAPPEDPASPSVDVEKSLSHSQQERSVKSPESLCPPPLELMHFAFRQFLFEVSSGPLKFPSSTSPPDLKDAAAAASKLMRLIGRKVKDRRHLFCEFLEYLKTIFPSDNKVVWIKACPHFGEVCNADATYIWQRGSVDLPLIMLQITQELDGPYDPDVQLRIYYEKYLSSMHNPCLTGAPVFLVALCGTSMKISGAFCHGGQSKFLVEELAAVNLVHNTFSQNERTTVSILYALKTALIDLMVASPPINITNVEFPRIIPCTDIDEMLVPHRLYLGRFRNDQWQLEYYLNNDSSLMAKVQSAEKYILKIICFRAQEQYGKDVHSHLASKGLAPQLLRWHRRLHDGLGMAFIEYLAPPKEDQAGWLTLHDFGVDHPEQAQAEKDAIQTHIYEDILPALQEKNFVHGDLRPNNIMIHVDKHGSLVKHDGKVILKVIDFDWSGVASQVFYPFDRNSSIPWPGKTMIITENDDHALVKTWMKFWPEPLPTLPEVY